MGETSLFFVLFFKTKSHCVNVKLCELLTILISGKTTNKYKY